MFIALDIGNVLMEVNIDPLCSALYDFEFVDSKAQALQKMDYLFPLMELGHHSFECLLRSGRCYLTDWQMNSLKETLDAVIQPRQEILDWLKKISTKHDIALLSNIGYDNVRAFDCVKEFDPLIKFYSCEWGLRKPSRAYYRTFTSIYPHFKGAVYVDDRIENVTAAKEEGFVSKHFCLDDDPGTGLERLRATIGI